MIKASTYTMFVILPTEDGINQGPCEIDIDDGSHSATYDSWNKLPLHTVDNGRTLRIATAASWLVNWILLFSNIAAVIVSNSKAVSFNAITMQSQQQNSINYVLDVLYIDHILHR